VPTVCRKRTVARGAVAVTRKPRDVSSRGFFCWSGVVGRGGVEPPTFRFSGVTSPLLTALLSRSDGGGRVHV
jgi:hypothetical protein